LVFFFSDIDDCALNNNPCLNGAQCTDQIDDYSCACNPGYDGKNCENSKLLNSSTQVTQRLDYISIVHI
jgi:hypothetical protein